MKRISVKKNTLKIIAFPAIVLFIVIFVILIKKDYNFISLFNDAERLKEYILSYGNLAPFIFGIVQFLQVIISPIPGNLTTVAGGAIFGFWPSFLISAVSIILGSATAFGLSRIFGKPFVEWIIGKRNVQLHLDTISNNTKIIFIMIILLPFFPDDIICFVAGISGMSWGFFLLTMLLARPPGLIVSALVDHQVTSIMLNSFPKYKTRDLPGVKTYLSRNGKLPVGLVLGLAAIITYYKGGVREDGTEIKPNDAPEIIALLDELWKTNNTGKIARGVLGADFIWGEDLNEIPGLTEQIKLYLDLIQQEGMLQTVKRIIQ